jgi:putative transcriptional regulator
MLRTLLFAALLGSSALARAADLSEAVILVAKPELKDAVYGSAVLVVKPIGNDQHVGFIVNRPTEFTLGKTDPIYLGGPMDTEMIFALVQRPDSPSAKAFELMPGLFATFHGPTIDQIIEKEPDHARLVAGLVAWKPGELREEIEKGAWYLLAPDAGLALRKPTDGLWEELVRHSQRAADSI